MKKSISFLPFIAVLFSLMAITSCSKSTDSGKEQPTKDVNEAGQSIIKPNMNESIQTTFFDTSFGATKEEVVSYFKKHGLTIHKSFSDDNILRFTSTLGESFSFGNMSWSHINVYLKNNKFYGIEFCNFYKEKFSAESDYNSILSALKAKYKMAEEVPSDTLTYKIQKGVDEKGHVVQVDFLKGESVDHKTWYYSYLRYGDLNILNEPSDEL